MNEFLETNLSLWNKLAKQHQTSQFYDVPAFVQGATSLKHVELQEMGDVEGKNLLHLQCHFGMDTLSWVRSGARATGVDFSDEAISGAKKLAEETGLEARFIQSDVLKLKGRFPEEFDIVFTSYGVVCWLADLKLWAEIIAESLKPGGTFYMVEFHPLARMLDDDGNHLSFGCYFEGKGPEKHEEEGSYADPSSKEKTVCYEWPHGLGELVSALIGAGLQLEFLHEFPYSAYQCFPYLQDNGDPERFTLKDEAAIFAGKPHKIPLMYSIKAHKPE